MRVPISYPFHSWHISRPSRPSWFTHSHNVRQSSCLCSSLTHVTSSHFDPDINFIYLFTKTLRPYFLINRKQVFTHLKTKKKKYWFVTKHQCFPTIFPCRNYKNNFSYSAETLPMRTKKQRSSDGSQQISSVANCWTDISKMLRGIILMFRRMSEMFIYSTIPKRSPRQCSAGPWLENIVCIW